MGGHSDTTFHAGTGAAAGASARDAGLVPGRGGSTYIVLLSVKPCWADAILDGRKRVELRRRFSPDHAGATIVLYASAPVSAVVGVVRLDAVTRACPTRLWAVARAGAAVTRRQFRDYFRGCRQAAALELSGARVLPAPIPLSRLREWAPGFTPPVSHGIIEPTSPVWRRLRQSVAAGAPDG
jgi:predicted transcriptional regulator